MLVHVVYAVYLALKVRKAMMLTQSKLRLSLVLMLLSATLLSSNWLLLMPMRCGVIKVLAAYKALQVPKVYKVRLVHKAYKVKQVPKVPLVNRAK